jgi:DNA ligase-1
MKLATLYKRSTTGKIVEWVIEVEGCKYRTISGFTDGEKVTSAWTVCAGKNTGKKNATTNEDQALLEATAIHRKRKEVGSFENILEIDTKVFYKPMLANKLEDYIDELVFPVFSQPKLDGVRCIVKEDGMWTRTGKPILSAQHIRDDLDPWFKRNPDLILDGELYCDKLANDFNKIISLVRKSKPTKDDLLESKGFIKFFVYDLPSSDLNFLDRSYALSDLDLPKSCVEIVPTYILHKKEDIRTQYELYMEQGYEGQMIRTNSPYENKRTKSLLKDKEFITDEFVILGMEEGVGNMSGKVGKLYFKTNDGKEFDSAVNGDWDYLAELLKRKDVIGKTATVKYFRLTPDGAPRFGKVIAIRDYE